MVDFGGGPFFGAGTGDAFVAKLDTLGELIWAAQFGDATYDQASGIATDSLGNVLVTGSFEGVVDFGGGSLVAPDLGAMFLLKLSP